MFSFVVATLSCFAAVFPAAAASVSYVAHLRTDDISVVDNESGETLGTIDLGDAIRPYAVALTPDGRYAYLVNQLPGLVAIIDLDTNEVVSRFTIVGAHGVVVAPDGSLAYALGSSYVSVIDVAMRAVVKTIPFPSGVGAFAITPDHRRMFVGGPDELVEVVDPRTGVFIESLRVRHSRGLFASPDGRRIYALGPDSIETIDTTTLGVQLIRVTGAHHIDFTPDGELAWVTQFSMATAIDVTSSRIVARVSLTGSPGAVAVAPSGSFLYVASSVSGGGCCGGQIDVIDRETRQVTQTVELAARPGLVAFSRDGSKALLSYSDARAVSIVDTETHRVSPPIDIGGRAFAAEFAGESLDAYVATNDTLTLVDAESQTAVSVLHNAGPSALVGSRSGERLYVLNAEADDLVVVDTATNVVVDTILLRDKVGLPVLTPDEKFLYLGDAECPLVHVFDLTARKFVATVSTGDSVRGGDPAAAAVSPDGRTVYFLIQRNFSGVVAFDTDTHEIRDRIDLPEYEGGRAIVAHPNGTSVFVTGFFEYYGKDHILEIDAQLEGIVADIKVAGSPVSMAILPNGEALYVRTANGVAVVDTRSAEPVALIRVPQVAQIVADPDGQAVYATQPGIKSIAKIDTMTNAVVGTMRLAEAPDRVAVVDVPLPDPSATSTATATTTPTATRTPVPTGTATAVSTVTATVVPTATATATRTATETSVPVTPTTAVTATPTPTKGDGCAVDPTASQSSPGVLLLGLCMIVVSRLRRGNTGVATLRR